MNKYSDLKENQKYDALNKDINDLVALYDNPDEEFAKKNYGSVEAYKKMLKRKMAIKDQVIGDDLISTISDLSDDEFQDWKSKSFFAKTNWSKSELLVKLKNIKKNREDVYSLKKEATTTSAVAGVNTPFAFSKKSIGNLKAAKQLGYKLAKIAREKLKNDKLQEKSFIDKNGLVQHNDPNIDPNLVTYKDTVMPTTENKKVLNTVKHIINDKCLTKESNTRFKFEQEGDADINSYDIQADFTDFDQKLKDSTETLKTDLQKKLNSKLANKKIVVRAAKGYKQPESDYKVNVMGVEIDYYYDRYMIIIVGRQENKQKTQRFFVKPGFKIKILGSADVSDSDMQKMKSAQNIIDTDDSDSNVVTKSKSEPKSDVGDDADVQSDVGDDADVQPDVGAQPSNVIPSEEEEEEEEEEDDEVRSSTIQESFDKHVNLFKNKL